MTAADPWAEVTAARLPAAWLGYLAAVRDRDGVRVHVSADGMTAWVTWPAGLGTVAECLRPAQSVAFFVPRDGTWFRFGNRVPTSERPPRDGGKSLDAVLHPGKVAPIPPNADSVEPIRVGVVRGGSVRPASVLRCRAGDLLPWAEVATTAELAAVSAARRGDAVMLRGSKLPAVPGAVRFWGDALLVPLGFRPDPDLPPGVIRAAAGVGENDLLVLDESGAAVVPTSAFAPLTRAAVRLAAGE